MTQADEIFNKIQRKRKAIETITNWLSLNPLSCINDELKEARSKKRKEVKELRQQLNELFEKSM